MLSKKTKFCQCKTIKLRFIFHDHIYDVPNRNYCSHCVYSLILSISMCILILLNILLLQHLVIKFVIGLRQVGDFLQVLLFPPRPIKTDRLDITIHHSSSHSPIRCGSRHLPKGGGRFFLEKKIGFQNNLF